MPEKTMCEVPAGSQLVVTPAQIEQRVTQMAHEISRAMADNQPWLVVGVLRGAFIFMADLVRRLEVEVLIDFIQISSYGEGVSSKGAITLLTAPTMEIAERSVLLVDDVLDTGNSMQWLISYFARQQARQVKSCVLLDKPACRKTAISADYAGFALPPGFVVGYGMDAAQKYRQLPGIYQLPEDKVLC